MQKWEVTRSPLPEGEWSGPLVGRTVPARSPLQQCRQLGGLAGEKAGCED